MHSDPETPELEEEVQSVTTVSPGSIPNHQPLFKSLQFHERLLTRNFEGDQHFFRSDGSVAAYSTMSASEARDPFTVLVPHEDAPAFSDIATTATAAATSPLTTPSPATPRLPLSLPRKTSNSKERSRAEEKMEPTTGPLTTQVPLHSRGSVPVQSLSSFPAGGRSGPSSTKTDKEDDRGAAKTDKSIWGNPLTHPTLPPREQGKKHPPGLPTQILQLLPHLS